jgi:hypothetical protein
MKVVELRKLYQELDVKGYNGISAYSLNKDGLIDGLLKFQKGNRNSKRGTKKTTTTKTTVTTIVKTTKKRTPVKSRKKVVEKAPSPRKERSSKIYTKTQLRKMRSEEVRELYVEFYGEPNRKINKPELIELVYAFQHKSSPEPIKQIEWKKSSSSASPKKSPKKSPMDSPWDSPKFSSKASSLGQVYTYNIRKRDPYTYSLINRSYE